MDDETTKKEMTCDHSADLEAMCLEDLGVVSGDWRGLLNCGKYMHEFITFIFRMYKFVHPKIFIIRAKIETKYEFDTQ